MQTMRDFFERSSANSLEGRNRMENQGEKPQCNGDYAGLKAQSRGISTQREVTFFSMARDGGLQHQYRRYDGRLVYRLRRRVSRLSTHSVSVPNNVSSRISFRRFPDRRGLF